MHVERVCLLGLGEVGAILAEDLLVGTSVQLRVWDRLLDDPASPVAYNFKRLAENPRLGRASSAGEAAADCDVVLSVVTAEEALNAADSLLPGLRSGAWFVDFNSVSPGTKCQLHDIVEGAGGRFVEASIMSSVPARRSGSPILLSGSHAAAFVSLGRSLGFTALQAVSDQLGVASATKMCRSVVVKGMEALVTESLLAARHYGVEQAVLASLNDLFPRQDWPDQARYLISRPLLHGTRRAEEMREAASTVAQAGVNPWMSMGCAERQAWAVQFKGLLGETTLEGLLDAIRIHMSHNAQEH